MSWQRDQKNRQIKEVFSTIRSPSAAAVPPLAHNGRWVRRLDGTILTQASQSAFATNFVWCMLCGFDERGYGVYLQRTTEDVKGEPFMVVVGCRSFTLKEARSHWISARSNTGNARRRASRQILQLIAIGVERYNYKINNGKAIKFDPTPRGGRN